MAEDEAGSAIPPLDLFVLNVVAMGMAFEDVWDCTQRTPIRAREVAEMLETRTLKAICEVTQECGACEGWHRVCADELGTRGIDVGA